MLLAERICSHVCIYSFFPFKRNKCQCYMNSRVWNGKALESLKYWGSNLSNYCLLLNLPMYRTTTQLNWCILTAWLCHNFFLVYERMITEFFANSSSSFFLWFIYVYSVYYILHKHDRFMNPCKKQHMLGVSKGEEHPIVWHHSAF